MTEIKLKWLNKGTKGIGVTWGIPWEKGILKNCNDVLIKNSFEQIIPAQNWVLAYWPDGSIKWTAHAISVNDQDVNELKAEIVKDPKIPFINPLKVIETDSYIKIDTNKIRCKISKKGENIIDYIEKNQKVIVKDVKHICINQKQYNINGYKTNQEEMLGVEVTDVSVESNGPVRCTVKIKGRHIRDSRMHYNSATLKVGALPFEIRLYFYANQDLVKIVHTFFHNGNPYEDFLKGLGLKFELLQNGPLYNRHILFGVDDEVYSESPKLLMTTSTRGKYLELYKKQINEMTNIKLNENEDGEFIQLLAESATWNNYKLSQLSSEHFVIKKQTNDGMCFIKSKEGKRANGCMYIGSENGGIAIGLKDFWQKYPSGLEARDLSQNKAKGIVWFWPPEAEPMDLRPYDTNTHVSSSYEGFYEMRSTPYGIANTDELIIKIYDEHPSKTEFSEFVENCSNPPLLVCESDYYKETSVFGPWSLKNTKSEKTKFIEEQLDELIKFYINEVEKRKWYGYWDYGDVMHSFDPIRKVWRYDIGGCAWQNTELVPNMWFWYMFLRTGDDKIFRLAQAMTRHTSEVDVYHFGEYRALGSRHNVLHYGCGCKEARISMSFLHRFYYYLTADERIGQILDEVKDVDFTVANLNPMRSYIQNNKDLSVNLRIGPDIMTFVANWFTRWERFNDEKYKNKIQNVLSYIKNHPYTFISGGVYNYYPEDNKLELIELFGGDHFMFCFGNLFVWLEIAWAMEDIELEDLCVKLGLFYTEHYPEKKEMLKKLSIPNKAFNLSVYNCGLAAFAANKTQNHKLAKEVWDLLLNTRLLNHSFKEWKEKYEKGTADENELMFISTNGFSQWSLNVIMCLEFIGDALN